MGGQRHLLITSPSHQLNLALDTSFRIAHGLWENGAEVRWTTVGEISWWSRDRSPKAVTRRLEFKDGPADFVEVDAQQVFLSDFSAIHMRADPPFDETYLAATWILDGVGPMTKVYNNPNALRTHNEKLSTFLFPEWTKPTLVSSNVKEMLLFSKTQGQDDVILKPLNMFAGRGIQRLNLREMSEAQMVATLDQYTHGETIQRLVQPFDQKVTEGEVRCFSVGAEIFTYCLKKPAAGNFLANTGAGATLHAFKPGSVLEARVKSAAQRLAEAGIQFVGFDLIGEDISEINITSPRLLLPPGSDPSVYQRIAEWVIEDVDKTDQSAASAF